jgi:hypothetical protein
MVALSQPAMMGQQNRIQLDAFHGNACARMDTQQVCGLASSRMAIRVAVTGSHTPTLAAESCELIV